MMILSCAKKKLSCKCGSTSIVNDANYIAVTLISKAFLLQAIGDGGQGWANALLYIFLSPTMRRRLLIKPIGKMLIVVGDKLADLLETDLETNSRAGKHVNATSNSLNESSTLVTAAGYQIKKYASTTTEPTIFSAAGTTPGTAPQNLQSSTRSVNRSSQV